MAVNKQNVNCVKLLLLFYSDCSLHDCFGDTALHDIISKEINEDSKQIIQLLIPWSSLNLTNHRGFNSLHHASLIGNVLEVVFKIIFLI